MTMKHRQRGITFLGLLMIGSVVGILAIFASMVVPTYIEYRSILRAAQHAAGAGKSVVEIRNAFDKTAAIDYFTAVKGRDLLISKENDKIIVEFAYQKEIHLVGPAYLLMKYAGRSD